MKKTDLRQEQDILHLSIAGCIFFMVAEVIMAYITHSHSIMMDCIFDIADLIMVGPFLILVPLLRQPVTEKRPYGFSQVESLFVMVKYIVLLVVTACLILDNIRLILNGGNHVDAGIIAIFEFFVGVICCIMYLLLSRLSRKYTSPSIKAEVYIWKLDVISSLGVSLAFFTQTLLENTFLSWVAPYIDPVVAIVMALLLIAEPVRMILRSARDLVLFAPSPEIFETIKQIVDSEITSSPYNVSFLDVIHTGRKLWVEVYISSPSDNISLSQIRSIRKKLYVSLHKLYDNVYIEIIPD